MNQKALSRFEALAQRLVEGSFRRLFGGPMEPLEIATHLARVLEDELVHGRPAHAFSVALHPSDYARVTVETPDAAAQLAAYTLQLAQRAGWTLVERPSVNLQPDANLRRGQVRVAALPVPSRRQTTTQVQAPRGDTDPAAEELQALQAFLLVEGRRHVPLDRPLVTLGRRADNDVVLESRAVSRRQAQIRWRFGHFVLYDLSGKGTTLVNGTPETAYVLRSGDVIGLSNVLILYGEGGQRPADTPQDSATTTALYSDKPS